MDQRLTVSTTSPGHGVPRRLRRGTVRGFPTLPWGPAAHGAAPHGHAFQMALLVLLVCTGAHAQPSAEVMASPFGIVNPWPEVGEGGMGAVWCRCGGGATQLGDWPTNEPVEGVYDWARAEAEWEQFYVREKLVPAPILSYTPRWASCSPSAENARSRPPRDLWSYYRFCRDIAAQFKGRIWFWEIWNEPNIGFFDGTIAEYTDLLKAGAAGVSAGSPEAYVVFGGMAGVDIPFADRCYQYGARDYFDIMAAHPYQWDKTLNDGWFFEKLTNLRGLLSKWDDGAKPIWLNELGWSTGDSRITDEDQARLLVQTYVSAISRRDAGIERVFWFCVKDWGGPNYGVYADDGARKPAWYAYRNMVQRLSGMVCAGRVQSPEDTRAYLFEAEGRRPVMVTWAAGLDPVEWALPESLAALKAWDMRGEALAPAAGPHAVTPAPIYLELGDPPAAELLAPVEPLDVVPPDPGRRSPVWLSVYPQAGCCLPWLRRGGETRLSARLFNASQVAVEARVHVAVTDPNSGATLAETTSACGAGAMSDATFSITVPYPENAPEHALLLVSAQSPSASIPPLRIEALVGDGPVLNFLANSYLEREWYLEPGGDSGCAESVRFGSKWSYRMPVPFAGSAAVRMEVGAHQAHDWTVGWSQDGTDWHPLMSGASHRAWHEKTIEGLRQGSLYLRCEGRDQQVGQVIVALTPGL